MNANIAEAGYSQPCKDAEAQQSHLDDAVERVATGHHLHSEMPKIEQKWRDFIFKDSDMWALHHVLVARRLRRVEVPASDGGLSSRYNRELAGMIYKKGPVEFEYNEPSTEKFFDTLNQELINDDNTTFVSLAPDDTVYALYTSDPDISKGSLKPVHLELSRNAGLDDVKAKCSAALAEAHRKYRARELARRETSQITAGYLTMQDLEKDLSSAENLFLDRLTECTGGSTQADPSVLKPQAHSDFGPASVAEVVTFVDPDNLDPSLFAGPSTFSPGSK